MEFQGPGTTDYENVSSLNRAFLALISRDKTARSCLAGLREPLASRLVTLSGSQADRLAATPFLLMSFRERDDRFWDAAFTMHPGRDLFTEPRFASDELGRLVSAGLGFVWQLAKQNPYAARLICGASVHWCEQLAERTFCHLLAIAGMRNGIPVLRSASDAELWSKLLANGVSRERQVRRAAHISALQSVLTRASTVTGKTWATAACAAKSPSLCVADEREI